MAVVRMVMFGSLKPGPLVIGLKGVWICLIQGGVIQY